MGGGDVHAGERGGFVDMVAEPDNLGHGLLPRRPVEIHRRVVNRIAFENEESLDRAGLDARSQLLDRRRGRRLHRHEVDGLTDIPQRGVHQVRERVHHGRLVCTGQDEAFTLVRQEIGGALGDPFRLDLQPLGQPGVGIGPEHAAREGRRERGHVAAGDAQAVVGHRSSDGEPAFRHIQPVHLTGVVLGGDAAALGEAARMGGRRRVGLEKIAVQTDDAPRLREAVHRFQIAAESGAGGLDRRLVDHRLVFRPDGCGEFLLQPGHQGSARGRTG